MPQKRLPTKKPASAPWDSTDAIDPSKGGISPRTPDGSGMAGGPKPGLMLDDVRPVQPRSMQRGDPEAPSSAELKLLLDEAAKQPKLLELLLSMLSGGQGGE